MVQAVVLLVREYSTRKTLIQKAAIAELLQIAGYGVEVGVMRCARQVLLYCQCDPAAPVVDTEYSVHTLARILGRHSRPSLATCGLAGAT